MLNQPWVYVESMFDFRGSSKVTLYKQSEGFSPGSVFSELCSKFLCVCQKPGAPPSAPLRTGTPASHPTGSRRPSSARRKSVATWPPPLCSDSCICCREEELLNDCKKPCQRMSLCGPETDLQLLVWSEFRTHLVLHPFAHLPALAGSECWVPVCGVPGSHEAVCPGHNPIQFLLVQTGTVCSVLVPPAEPEGGWPGVLDPCGPRGQLLETEPQLLGYS